MVFNQKNGFFSGAFSNGEIEKLYFDAVADINAHIKLPAVASNSNSSGKVMTVPPSGGVCTDWYWTVYAVDEDGNILYIISETYINTTCTDPNGGGDTCECAPPEPEWEPDFGSPKNTDLGNSPEMVEIVGLDSFRVSNVFWEYHGTEAFSFNSTERGAVKTNGGTRLWHSLRHISTDETHDALNHMVTLENQTFYSTLGIGLGHATMHATYKVRYTTNINGLVRDKLSRMTGSSASWDVYFQRTDL